MSVAEKPNISDLSALPESVRGPAGLAWWSNLCFMLIEGSGFALAAGAYLYLQSQSTAWPPANDQRPDLGWGTAFTVYLLASVAPNLWLASKARAHNVVAVRWGILLMALLGVGLAVVRGYELAHLNVHWAHDAYGSVTWLLMLLHTTHVLTEVAETGVLALWLMTHEIGGDQFADVENTTIYWNFVVLAWLPIYALVYWAPRIQ